MYTFLSFCYKVDENDVFLDARIFLFLEQLYSSTRLHERFQ